MRRWSCWNWIREHRGIYRLADFPTTERPDLMLWYLWSKNRQEIPEGIYSHETALSLTLGVRQWSEPLK